MIAIPDLMLIIYLVEFVLQSDIYAGLTLIKIAFMKKKKRIKRNLEKYQRECL